MDIDCTHALANHIQRRQVPQIRYQLPQARQLNRAALNSEPCWHQVFTTSVEQNHHHGQPAWWDLSLDTLSCRSVRYCGPSTGLTLSSKHRHCYLLTLERRLRDDSARWSSQTAWGSGDVAYWDDVSVLVSSRRATKISSRWKTSRGPVLVLPGLQQSSMIAALKGRHFPRPPDSNDAQWHSLALHPLPKGTQELLKEMNGSGYTWFQVDDIWSLHPSIGFVCGILKVCSLNVMRRQDR